MALNKERLKSLYRDMYLIRNFEELIKEYAANGTIPGFVHLSTGQEACEAGVVRALRTTDYKYPDHRGHGAILLCGTDPKYVMAEIFGRATGINGGRGGSMHVHDWSCHNHGFNGIQGSTCVTALGTAFAAKYRHTDDVSAIFMGDGTLGEGTCHESMNMAATWKLPVIYCLINNGYAISTPSKEAHPQEELRQWADGYGVPSWRIDGNDIEAVVEITEEAVNLARKGKGPSLIEFVTYRWQGHFAGDPASYRPAEELEYWKKRDPLILSKKVLIEREGVTQEEISAIENEVDNELQACLKFTLDSPWPVACDALTHVYEEFSVEARQ
ncbi:MAG: thiamine pyrophosphate-dependent dehydrogenase E1 component subunit alpha [Lachnospiraceae bacterium]|jgi:pyruvate dehydrogenase E1 component alpha subunit|nr:thiamine pyrophosphate-dependent dehydrogenase E1 component subunit alpha [Lachnospiraceae bacterium]